MSLWCTGISAVLDVNLFGEPEVWLVHISSHYLKVLESEHAHLVTALRDDNDCYPLLSNKFWLRNLLSCSRHSRISRRLLITCPHFQQFGPFPLNIFLQIVILIRRQRVSCWLQESVSRNRWFQVRHVRNAISSELRNSAALAIIFFKRLRVNEDYIRTYPTSY